MNQQPYTDWKIQQLEKEVEELKGLDFIGCLTSCSTVFITFMVFTIFSALNKMFPAFLDTWIYIIKDVFK